jgi:hypothetical protein
VGKPGNLEKSQKQKLSEKSGLIKSQGKVREVVWSGKIAFATRNLTHNHDLFNVLS